MSLLFVCVCVCFTWILCHLQALSQYPLRATTNDETPSFFISIFMKTNEKRKRKRKKKTNKENIIRAGILSRQLYPGKQNHLSRILYECFSCIQERKMYNLLESEILSNPIVAVFSYPWLYQPTNTCSYFSSWFQVISVFRLIFIYVYE